MLSDTGPAANSPPGRFWVPLPSGNEFLHSFEGITSLSPGLRAARYPGSAPRIAPELCKSSIRASRPINHQPNPAAQSINYQQSTINQFDRRGRGREINTAL
jgi:hypothetical protein